MQYWVRRKNWLDECFAVRPFAGGEWAHAAIMGGQWPVTENPKKYHWVATRHGAEQYTGYLEFVFYGYHLDRAIPRISEAVYCLTPSLVATHDDTSDCMYHV